LEIKQLDEEIVIKKQTKEQKKKTKNEKFVSIKLNEISRKFNPLKVNKIIKKKIKIKNRIKSFLSCSHLSVECLMAGVFCFMQSKRNQPNPNRNETFCIISK